MPGLSVPAVTGDKGVVSASILSGISFAGFWAALPSCGAFGSSTALLASGEVTSLSVASRSPLSFLSLFLSFLCLSLSALSVLFVLFALFAGEVPFV